MQSHIILQLLEVITSTFNTCQLPDFCNWPIQYAQPNLHILRQGQILTQSHSNYLAYIELYEYMLAEDVLIKYSREKNSLFMLLMLEGSSSLYQPEKKFISESPAGTIHMGYINKGDYIAEIKAGKSELLLLTIRAKWLKRKARKLEKLKPLIDHHKSNSQSQFSLEQCRLTQNVLKPLKNMFAHNGQDSDDLDATINTTLIKLIGQYHQMLVKGDYTTNEFYRSKGVEINNFILKHYSEKIIEDTSGLARILRISERTLLRISKHFFNRSFHQQVIYCRVHYGLNLLLTTPYSLQNIAKNVGYSDVKYFSKAFQKQFNILPSVIRDC